jgi:hypothetical protein
MIVSTYIERPVLVDIRVRKSKHGGASVPVVKPPISPKINIEVPSGIETAREIIGEQKTVGDIEKIPDKIPEKIPEKISEKIIANKPEKVLEKMLEKIPKVRTGELLYGKETKKEEQEKEDVPKKETPKKNKQKDGVSLYAKMFGSRKK